MRSAYLSQSTLAIDMNVEHCCLTLVGSSGNRDFSVGVQGLAKERGVCIGNGLLETRTTLDTMSQVLVVRQVYGCIYLGWGVLVALNAIQRVLCSVNCEFRGVVTASVGIIASAFAI